MKTWKKIVSIFCGLTLMACLSACEQEGPAEKAGEKVDQTIEEGQEMMEETAEEAGEKVEEAGEEMQH
ncbi:MAG: hypothetical protein ACQES8_09950 [Thermodesulfobacteriota bacterium]